MATRPQFIVTSILIGIGAFVVLGYAYLKTRDYIAGPQVTIHSPKNGATLSDSLVEISGTAKNISFISLNDRPIFVDDHGAFKEKLLLYQGYNIISVKAEDRYKRMTEKKLELIITLPPKQKETSGATSSPERQTDIPTL